MDYDKTFESRAAMATRIEEIRKYTTKNPGQAEQAPDGRLISTVNSRLYFELDFLTKLLEESATKFPVTMPRFPVR